MKVLEPLNVMACTISRMKSPIHKQHRYDTKRSERRPDVTMNKWKVTHFHLCYWQLEKYFPRRATFDNNSIVIILILI